MIELMIALLIAMSGQRDPCAIGENVNWYEWTAQYDIIYRLGEAKVNDEFDVLFLQGEEGGDEVVIFIYDMDRWPHGQCSRRVYRSQLAETLADFQMVIDGN